MALYTPSYRGNGYEKRVNQIESSVCKYLAYNLFQNHQYRDSSNRNHSYQKINLHVMIQPLMDNLTYSHPPSELGIVVHRQLLNAQTRPLLFHHDVRLIGQKLPCYIIAYSNYAYDVG